MLIANCLKYVVLMDTSRNGEMFISIAIPVRNDVENLKKCLNGIMQSTYPHYENLIVDDSSNDEPPTFTKVVS